MTRHHRPVRRGFVRPLLVIAALSLLVTACSRIVGPRTFTSTAEFATGATWTVRVIDNSGRVVSIAIDPAPPLADNAGVPFNDPAAPARLVVPWVGGQCDHVVTFTIGAMVANSIPITYATEVGPGVCDAIGVSHQLVLETEPAVAAAAVKVSRAP